jgi:hypothetical protein
MKVFKNDRLIPHLLSGCILSLLPLTAAAAIFTTNLEVPDQVDPALTTTVINNGLSADFTGGTIDKIGVGALYHSGSKSWMVSPNGDTAPLATGPSTGTGTITLSEPATRIQVFGKNEAGVTVAEVRLFDTNSMMIGSATSLTDTTWTDIDVTRIQGETLIASIQLVVLSGSSTGMAVLDDLTFDNGVASPGGGGGSGSMTLFQYISLLLLTVLRAIKSRTRL